MKDLINTDFIGVLQPQLGGWILLLLLRPLYEVLEREALALIIESSSYSERRSFFRWGEREKEERVRE